MLDTKCGLNLQTWKTVCLRLNLVAQFQLFPHPQLTPASTTYPVDLREWEDYGIDQDAPDPPTSAHYFDIALAALLKGLPGFNAKELIQHWNTFPWYNMVLYQIQYVLYYMLY